MATIGLIDYGAGNFTSVLNAFARLGIDTVPISTPAGLGEADRLVLPGVGAFKTAVDRLEVHSLVDALRTHVLENRKLLLGICVGMQILADVGHEFGATSGLGYVPGMCEMIPGAERGLRVPHMGWNEVTFLKSSPLFEGIGNGDTFYFVHSYHLNPADPGDVLATTEYGGAITAAVGRDNVLGVQFHPEKSQNNGLRVLRNFASMNVDY